ncbi:Z-ring formation inhibitor MciZ [Bacillus sp. T33-2]|uniref:Z-ring formation inhibitor MciZ n=1 Tax=Bacillus sp. T33-2 TaxID=2054168 RepID=UPI000C78F468|nr:Z-ring formation inhibitor MciZ [Bacillus sp. T33-2]PLR99822.1 Z-ring formation inhibitor MciZ [Bacillus sp. T33-2]
MKVYVHEKGIVLAGKAWEVKRKLKEYSRDHMLVQDWVTSVSNTQPVRKSCGKAASFAKI